MKALVTTLVSGMFLCAPAVAGAAGSGAEPMPVHARHMARRRAGRMEDRAGSRVSVGSDVRITPTGEVIAPQMQILAAPPVPAAAKPAQP